MPFRSEAGRRHRRGRPWRAALALLLLPVSPVAAAPPRAAGQEASGPDFSSVTTRAAAGKLVRKRQLVRIHLVPIELGGTNGKFNIGYVTPQAALAHAQLVDTLSRYVERDLVDHLEIVPEYKGDSIVPTRIRMKATHSRGGESFERVIGVWGSLWSAPEPLADPDTT